MLPLLLISKMEVAIKTLFSNLNPSINSHYQMLEIRTTQPHSQLVSFPSTTKSTFRENATRKWNRYSVAVQAKGVSPGLNGASFSTSSIEDVEVIVNKCEAGEMEILVTVSQEKTQVIFDKVFSKMVAAAQPIPGFRRVKGGKTPDIPKDVLLHILGPSKVKGNTIKKIISSAVGDYVKKEDLKVTKDLRVEQRYEDLEDTFEPGKQFSFNAIIRLAQ